jgi:hypothetical protein
LGPVISISEEYILGDSTFRILPFSLSPPQERAKSERQEATNARQLLAG